MQTLNSGARATARAALADGMLLSAQLEANSIGTRCTCACDALYLYALAAAEAPAGKQRHPYTSLLLKGALLLDLDMHAVSRVALQMRIFGAHLSASPEQVAEQIELAKAAQQAWRRISK